MELKLFPLRVKSGDKIKNLIWNKKYIIVILRCINVLIVQLLTTLSSSFPWNLEKVIPLKKKEQYKSYLFSYRIYMTAKFTKMQLWMVYSSKNRRNKTYKNNQNNHNNGTVAMPHHHTSQDELINIQHPKYVSCLFKRRAFCFFET